MNSESILVCAFVVIPTKSSDPRWGQFEADAIYNPKLQSTFRIIKSDV